jgi:hypothetical protein
MATKKLPEGWTKTHDTVLSGLTGMGLGKNYATGLLSGMKESDAAQMLRAALQAHTKSQNLSPVAGGPQNAVPINKQSTPPPLPMAQQPSTQKRGMLENVIRFMTGPNGPPKAPISPAVAQVSPPSMGGPLPQQPAITQAAAPGAAPQVPAQKPRIRIPAAGRRIPAAPLGSPTEAAQPPSEGSKTPSSTPMPRIRSEEEWQRLPSGTDFIWVPNGKQYTKEGK